MIPATGHRDASGFSLPEVTLALGLMAGVLISLSGLFVMADRMMRGGKSQTEALAVARNILEDTDAWHFRGLYERFGLDGSSASYTIDSRSNPGGAGWQADLDRGLHSAHAEISLESIVASGSPPPLAEASAVRVTVTVFWRDANAQQSVRLGTVRM